MAISKSASPLDNPVWHSLSTRHAGFAQGGELAKRFHPDIGPLAGLEQQSAESYLALGRLFLPDEFAVLFLESPPELPQGWRLLKHDTIVQMVCTEPGMVQTALRKDLPIMPLGIEDSAEMLGLATLTEPGPFRLRTSELGRFAGIREADRLAAMAGERMSLAGFTEVSAVCTHPDFRGRGYAKALVAAIAMGILDPGDTPFLTSYKANTSAIRVYESVGFTLRRTFDLAIVLPPPEQR
jgi:ribosomal protein S18 acetylase RimI-like enzyme